MGLREKGQMKTFKKSLKKSEIWPRDTEGGNPLCCIWRFNKNNLESDPRNIPHTSHTEGVLILFYLLCS